MVSCCFRQKSPGVKGNGKPETLPDRRPGARSSRFRKQPAGGPGTRRWSREELQSVRGQPHENITCQPGHRRGQAAVHGGTVPNGPGRLPDLHLNPAARSRLPCTERPLLPSLPNQIRQANRPYIPRKRYSKRPERDPTGSRPRHDRRPEHRICRQTRSNRPPMAPGRCARLGQGHPRKPLNSSAPECATKPSNYVRNTPSNAVSVLTSGAMPVSWQMVHTDCVPMAFMFRKVGWQ